MPCRRCSRHTDDAHHADCTSLGSDLASACSDFTSAAQSNSNLQGASNGTLGSAAGTADISSEYVAPCVLQTLTYHD